MLLKEYTGFRPEEILPLYHSVGWTNYTENPAMLEQAYRHSLSTIAAWDEDKLVGVIRAVGDGYSVVLVQDLLVHPGWQRNGVGTMLMRAMLNQYPSVYQFQLVTDATEKNVAFYQSLGMTRMEACGCCVFQKSRPDITKSSNAAIDGAAHPVHLP